MNNLVLSLLNSGSNGTKPTAPGWVYGLDIAALVLNFIAAAILAGALLPPFLDTRKSRMTYGLSLGFFMNYIYAALALISNAVVNIILFTNVPSPGVPAQAYLLFVVFMSINGWSLYLNSYIVKIKRTNMKESAEKGMTEQAYWEQYLNPERTSNTGASA